jgi:hypothetical protein
MADPAQNDSAEERRVALTKLGIGADVDPTDRDALMVQAANMIGLVAYQVAQATTIGDIKDARALAKAVQGYIHDRSLGIEAENPAAAIVLVSEYKAGAELIRMDKDEERMPEAGGHRVAQLARGMVSLADLGFEGESAIKQAGRWQQLARQHASIAALTKVIEDLPEGTRVSRAAISPGDAPEGVRVRKPIPREVPVEAEFDGIASIRKAVAAVTELQGVVANGALAIDIGELSWEDSGVLAREIEGSIGTLVAVLKLLRA